MASHQGLYLGFGSNKDSTFPTTQWPFATPVDNDFVTRQLITVSPGENLVLHVKLRDFEWNEADVLLILISKDKKEAPASVFLSKEWLSHARVTASVYQVYRPKRENPESVHFAFTHFEEAGPGMSGIQWRELNHFHVKVFRLQTVDYDGRTATELVANARFGPSTDDLMGSPKRDGNVRDLSLTRLCNGPQPEYTKRYRVLGGRGWPFSFAFYFRTPGWMKAFEQKTVEELRVGITARRSHGLFASQNAQDSSAIHLGHNTDDLLNQLNSLKPMGGESTGASTDAVASSSTDISPKRRHPRQEEDAGSDPGDSVIDVTPQKKSKRPKLTDQQRSGPSHGGASTTIDLSNGAAQAIRAITVERAASVQVLNDAPQEIVQPLLQDHVQPIITSQLGRDTEILLPVRQPFTDRAPEPRTPAGQTDEPTVIPSSAPEIDIPAAATVISTAVDPPQDNHNHNAHTTGQQPSPPSSIAKTVAKKMMPLSLKKYDLAKLAATIADINSRLDSVRTLRQGLDNTMRVAPFSDNVSEEPAEIAAIGRRLVDEYASLVTMEVQLTQRLLDLTQTVLNDTSIQASAAEPETDPTAGT